MHHQREVRQLLLNGLDAIEVQPLRAGELIGAVRRADGHGQRVAARALDELDGLVGIGQAGVFGRTEMSSSTPPSMPNSASTESPFS